jgi:hypothetical protein
MRISAFIFILSLVGCSTPQKGLWSHQKGGQAISTEKPGDTANISTSFGSLKIYPLSVNSAYGFVVKVWVENKSDKSISIKASDIKVQAKDQVYDPLDEGGVKSLVDANVGFTGAILGNGIGTTGAVNSDVWNRIKSQLLKDGDIPSKSVKVGHLYFAKEAASGEINFRIGESFSPSSNTVEFTGKNK